MDVMVLKAQQWMNSTYGNDSRYSAVVEDGLTGWGTINGLILALQIELGMAETAAVIGPTTRSKFNAKYPNGIVAQSSDDERTDNVHGIIQCALWCKGYYAESGAITGYYRGQSAASVVDLKADMGFTGNSTVTMEIMECLLSMKQFVLCYGGKTAIREIQQKINREYKAYTGIIPCDGLYGREMNTAIIQVLQGIEGYDPSVCNGNFGNGTKSALKTITAFNAFDNPDWVWIASVALVCNNLLSETTTTWTTAFNAALGLFQTTYALTVTEKLDVNTWMSLFISCGNTDRSSLGCDCSTILNADKANALYNAGYRYVGRYLSGTVNNRPKGMTSDELIAIFNADLRVFAIYQEGGYYPEYFTYERGKADGLSAVEHAKALGIPAGEFIYYAVDYDMMDYQVTSRVIPYFKGVRAAMRENAFLYKVGIYGSRNICTRVCNEKLATSSFVADMSTGYSGNLGFTIPANWAFDQFKEYSFTGASETFDLDKAAYSGRYSGFDHVVVFDEYYEREDKMDVYREQAEVLLNHFGIFVAPDAEFEFDEVYMAFTAPGIETKFKASVAAEINMGGNNSWGQVTISNGSVPEVEKDLLEAKYNALSAETKAFISSDGTFSIMSGLETEIENGRIAFWLECTSDGKIVMHYAIESDVFRSDLTANKLCVYVDITIDTTDNYAYEFETIKEYEIQMTPESQQALTWFTAGFLLTAGIIFIAVYGAQVTALGILIAVPSFLTTLIPELI